MSITLQKRIQTFVSSILQLPGSWLVWCDPQHAWLPLLQKVAENRRMGGFTLLPIDEWTGGRFGGPVSRQKLQAKIEAGENFVLYAPVAQSQLGWLWAQALLAEQIYDRPLRVQLLEWGWRPHSITVSDEEVALQARQNLARDPAQWGSGGIQADPELLINLLAGFALPTDENRFQLNLTVEQAGLSALVEDDLENWRKRSLARLLVTQAHQCAPALIPESHPLLVATDQRNFALELLERWLDSNRLSQRLPEAILEADRIASLGTVAASATMAVQPFLSHAAERSLFVAACTRLAQLQGRTLLENLAGISSLIQPHLQGFWGERITQRGNLPRVPWSELQRLSVAACDLVDATPATAWSTAQAAIDWYIQGGWRMDQAGEEINRNLESSTPELVALIAPLRAAYRARWEQTLIDWSELWSNSGCPAFTTLQSAGQWLKEQLANTPTPTAIVILDALRYDLGAKLVARLNQQEGAERATLAPTRAPLPSITALGMGLALPIDETELEATIVDKKWQLRRRGHPENLSVAENRRNWWQREGNVAEDCILDLPTIKSGAIPAPGRNRLRLVIYDAAIDTLGHDDELEFQGSGKLLDRYLDAIERLRDQDWRRILIATDHGFIHWTGSDERYAPKPLSEPSVLSRRAAAYPASATFSGPQALAPGGQWRIAFPCGAASFRAYGGLGYFHGGASLQEWIIPSLVVEWPTQAEPVMVSLEPLARIMTVRPKVVLQITSRALLPEYIIPRQIEVVVRAVESFKLLFRSNPLTASLEQSPKEVTLGQVEGATADRGSAVRIEVRDARTEEVLHAIDSVLMVELANW